MPIGRSTAGFFVSSAAVATVSKPMNEKNTCNMCAQLRAMACLCAARFHLRRGCTLEKGHKQVVC
jgi:hypothetical protein